MKQNIAIFAISKLADLVQSNTPFDMGMLPDGDFVTRHFWC